MFLEIMGGLFLIILFIVFAPIIVPLFIAGVIPLFILFLLIGFVLPVVFLSVLVAVVESLAGCFFVRKKIRKHKINSFNFSSDYYENQITVNGELIKCYFCSSNASNLYNEKGYCEVHWKKI